MKVGDLFINRSQTKTYRVDQFTKNGVVFISSDDEEVYMRIDNIPSSWKNLSDSDLEHVYLRELNDLTAKKKHLIGYQADIQHKLEYISRQLEEVQKDIDKRQLDIYKLRNKL